MESKGQGTVVFLTNPGDLLQRRCLSLLFHLRARPDSRASWRASPTSCTSTARPPRHSAVLMEPGAQGGGAGHGVARSHPRFWGLICSVTVSAGFFCADFTQFQMKEVIFTCIFFFLQGDKEKCERIFVQDLTISRAFYHCEFLNHVGWIFKADQRKMLARYLWELGSTVLWGL